MKVEQGYGAQDRQRSKISLKKKMRSLPPQKTKECTDPTGSVGGRAIDFGEVLAREGSSSVSTPSTVGVDDDLTTSQSSVTLRTTNDESARGLNL